jgi:SAM-dependent methyltransferase
MTTATSDVALYYDELHRWTARDRGFQVFAGFENDTIHRFLIDPDTGAFSPDTLYKYIDPYIAMLGPPRGLDAGCGYGGTAFRCLKVHGGHWTGVTISEQQWRYAQGIAKARGIEGAIDFYLMSYDAPLPGRYNVIVCIESLIHSADDMPVKAIPQHDQGLLAEFKRAWRCPVAPTAAAWIAAAQAAGLRLVAQQDLSHLQKPRPETDLDAALADLSAQREAKLKLDFGRLSDAEIGGLYLERLLSRGSVRYVMLVLEKC